MPLHGQASQRIGRGRGMTTIRDVARHAGVSPATVSRVLNGSAKVGDSVTERVNQAIQELRYRPNGVARSLRQQSTRVWGLLISDIQNPYFTSIVRGVEDEAQLSRSSLILCNSDENVHKERMYLEVMLNERVAGVIVSPASCVESDPTPLVEHGIPVVVVDRQFGHGKFDSVVIGNRAAADAAVRHLVSQGARRIGCIVGSEHISTSIERLAGYRDAMAELPAYDERGLVEFSDSKQLGGYEAALRILSRPQPPEALFVGNNLMAVGALEAIANLGLRIPKDIAVVAFDEMAWSSLLAPPLTTVRQPTYEVGQIAARQLAARIGGYSGPPREFVLDASLIVRRSSLLTVSKPTAESTIGEV
jgi:LacI family transcriptional regulator